MIVHITSFYLRIMIDTHPKTHSQEPEIIGVVAVAVAVAGTEMV